MSRRSRASGDVYRSVRLAASYAFARPSVHPHVVRLIATRLGLTAAARSRRALDIGCGTGLSTAPLLSIAEAVVGLEPSLAMLAHHQVVAPGASFVAGEAEALPFAQGTFDLVTCAGALNYADVDRALHAIAVALEPGGTLVIYDFSGGRRCREGPALDDWFAAFERRYPFPPGYALDAAGLDYRRFGLQLVAFDDFEVALRLAFDAYLAYVLSETNVERAVSQGDLEAEIRAWCRDTLAPLFERGALEVLFDGYIAYITGEAAPLTSEQLRLAR